MLAVAVATLLTLTTAQTEAPRPPPAVKMRSQERLPSLVSGETLGAGGSAMLATAGFPFLGAAWAQGMTPTLDLGAALDYDVSLSELFVGPTMRLSLGQNGATSLAFVARAGYYADLGADWFVSHNDANNGIQISPGLALSTRSGGGGVVTGTFDLPITATIKHGGSIVAPRARVIYEAPLYGDFTIGARLGAALRAASGDAPLADRDARFSVELGALLTYRLF